MPVLSESHPPGIATNLLPSITLIYVFLGASLLVLLGIYISRLSKSSQLSLMASSSSSSEKQTLLPTTNATSNTAPSSTSYPVTESQSAAPAAPAKPRIQRPPQPLPFTPPVLDQSQLQLQSQSPTEMTFSSFEALEASPRRRSYTKTMSDGTEVSGEIIVADGWRRHTRVFGGGVCKACEESERRMTA